MERFELTLIIEPGLSLEDAEKLIEKVEVSIAKNKGKAVSRKTWGVRSFAQPIKKKTSGYYYFLQFDLEPQLAAEVTKSYFYERPIIRYLLVNLTNDKTYFKQLKNNEVKEKEEKILREQTELRQATQFGNPQGLTVENIANAQPKQEEKEPIKERAVETTVEVEVKSGEQPAKETKVEETKVKQTTDVAEDKKVEDE